GWWLLPAGLKTTLFSRLQGPLAFVVVLETWMLSDAAATNLLGRDERSALDALQGIGGVRRLLRVKVAALAMVIGTVCAVLAAVIGVMWPKHPATAELLTPVFLAIPFGTIAAASWLGVLMPYRSRSLQWRWLHRRPWRTTVRWALLVVTPFWSVGLVITALVLPAQLLAGAVTRRHVSGPPPTSMVVVTVVTACTLSAVAFAAAPVLADRLARARRSRLVDYLRDPAAG
ncbi:MAG: hypothetical protein QOF57_810, partial [Frankiaceae bacterium]|nr:hypothetical protein [Frankiaceae bacterium]